MNRASRMEHLDIPRQANYAMQGSGAPVVLVHGLSSSLHDWDMLVPGLVQAGYATYAVDLLGHGDSPKPGVPLYQMEWLVDHFITWLQGLALPSAPVLIGHSLGGFIVLEYARRFPDSVRGLILVDPFYSQEQLPWSMRLAYSHPGATMYFMEHTPAWLVRWAIDVMSIFLGHSKGGLHALPQEVRAQTALDYMRTAPAAYGILNKRQDLTPYLASITAPTLVLWGEHDQTLAPRSFDDLVSRLPKATGRSRATGHVLHQAEAEWFGEQVLAFLATLPPAPAAAAGAEEFRPPADIVPARRQK